MPTPPTFVWVETPRYPHPEKTPVKILFVLLATGIAGAASAAPSNYLVVATGNGTTAARNTVVAHGGTVIDELGAIGVVVASADNANFAAQVAAEPGVLSADVDPDIQWIPPGMSIEATDLPPSTNGVNAEPRNNFLWNLRQVHADKTAAAGVQGQGAVVAVLDSGINTGHVDLKDNIDFVHSRAFVPSTDTSTGFAFEDDNFHGSHVACIIAGEINGAGIQGVAPKATIISLKTQNKAGSGSFGNVIRAIEYAVSLGNVEVINMSLGATFDRINKGGNGGAGPDNAFGHFLAALNRTINHATQAGILVVSAAGNEGVDLNGRLESIPAQSGNGIAISATGPVGLANFDRLASYSNFGASVIDFAAPGGDFADDATFPFDMVLSCGHKAAGQNSLFFAAGTSMAAPHVAGAAALVVGKYGHTGPAGIINKLNKAAVNVLPTQQQGAGRLDVGALAQQFVLRVACRPLAWCRRAVRFLE